MKSVIYMLLSACCLTACANTSPSPSTFTSFPDGKRCAFYLSFDDGCCSQITNVFPRLAKYRIHGTFYVCPGWPSFKQHEAEWSTTNEFVHIGNHTLDHGNISNAVSLAYQVAACNEAIHRLTPRLPWPRDIAWGIPGTETMQKLVPGITGEEITKLYTDNHLVERLPYNGYPVKYRTIPEMEAYIDSVVEKGGVGHLDFHGVGGDWLDPGLEYFDAMLRKLDSHRSEIWFAPWPEIHKWMCSGK